MLVACERSGTVRDAFTRAGHFAVSVDLELDLSVPRGLHLRRDIRDVLRDSAPAWDLMIAFPPCTHVAVSGAKHFAPKRADGRQAEAVALVQALARAPIPCICIENPVGILSTRWRKPDQVIQPWQYGHAATKATCLWLKGLPLLTPTNVVDKGMRTRHGVPSWYNLPDSADRARLRGRTFQGIADAMASQWTGAAPARAR